MSRKEYEVFVSTNISNCPDMLGGAKKIRRAVDMCLHVATAEHTLAAVSASTKFPQSTVEYGVETSSLRMLCLLLSGGLSPVGVPSSRWPQIVDAAQEHNQGPLLSWVLESAQVALPDELEVQLRRSALRAAARFMMLHKAQQDISHALEGAGIPHVWLKGIVLAETVYPDPSHRSMVDLDILVQEEHVPAALAHLQELTYRFDRVPSLFDDATRVREGSIHHLVLRGGTARCIVIELHFSLLTPRCRDFLSHEQNRWFNAQITRYVFEHDTFTALTDEAHLLYLCAHIVLQHTLPDFALTRFLDLHLLITRSALDWQMVLQKATDLRWSYVVELALQQTRDLFSTPIPTFVFDELRARPSPDGVRRRVDALQTPGALFESVRSTLANLDRRGQVAWIWRIAVPDPAFMRRRYEVPDNRSVAPYYVRRWVRQLDELGAWIRSRRSFR